MKKDIQTLRDIELLVNTFYEKIRSNHLIGHIFEEQVKDWSLHLPKMYRFWQTILLDEQTYQGRPFPPHLKMNLEQQHFEEWVANWRATIDTLFEGPVADQAKWRAQSMATMFQSKIAYFKDNGLNPLI